MSFEVPGCPPRKDINKSIRNRDHPLYSTFILLRRAAIAAMSGRAWVSGPLELHLTIFGPERTAGPTLVDYLGGVMDSLDGSSGQTFTYLPIVSEDDCQVRKAEVQWAASAEDKYLVEVFFR